MSTALTIESAAQLDLFGQPVTSRVHANSTPLVTRTGKVSGVRIGFDSQSFKDFKSVLAESNLNAEQKKAKRQEFLSADAIKQRQMLGILVLQRAYEADDHAPLGRVPEVMELRKGGTMKLVSVAEVLGHKPDTAKQKIAKLEAEIAALRKAEAERKALEAEAQVISSES